MTKLLDEAIAKVRELPEEDQDMVAAVVLSLTDEAGAAVPMDDETRAAVREGLDQARRGEFASEAEISAVWKRHGL